MRSVGKALGVMDSMVSDERVKALLRAKLTSIRNFTLALYAHLTPAQMQVAQLPTVNPPLWELGHIAWFQEYWCLRVRNQDTLPPSRYPHFDDEYNSSVIAHSARWALAHPSRDVILEQMRDILDDTLNALDRPDDLSMAGAGPYSGNYFFELAALHETMHAEAFSMTLQTLGLPAPPGREAASGEKAREQIPARDVGFPGGTFLSGTSRGMTSRFVFDNEKWGHPVRVEPFAIANQCVTNGEFAAFVDDSGYDTRQWWDEPGWAWRESATARHPLHWRRDGAAWYVRGNDRWQALADRVPVMHVNLHEARAWCAWAKRRLPTEAEWEYAATRGGDFADYPWGDDAGPLDRCALDGRTDHPVAADTADRAMASRSPLLHMIGNVWEWTDTPFEPYPGFAPDPYVDYSAPWFGDHFVLRGGSFVTSRWLIHSRFRNFYKPERRDAFAGFRTCAPD